MNEGIKLREKGGRLLDLLRAVSITVSGMEFSVFERCWRTTRHFPTFEEVKWNICSVSFYSPFLPDICSSVFNVNSTFFVIWSSMEITRITDMQLWVRSRKKITWKIPCPLSFVILTTWLPLSTEFYGRTFHLIGVMDWQSERNVHLVSHIQTNHQMMLKDVLYFLSQKTFWDLIAQENKRERKREVIKYWFLPWCWYDDFDIFPRRFLWPTKESHEDKRERKKDVGPVLLIVWCRKPVDWVCLSVAVLRAKHWKPFLLVLSVEIDFSRSTFSSVETNESIVRDISANPSSETIDLIVVVESTKESNRSSSEILSNLIREEMRMQSWDRRDAPVALIFWIDVGAFCMMNVIRIVSLTWYSLRRCLTNDWSWTNRTQLTNEQRAKDSLEWVLAGIKCMSDDSPRVSTHLDLERFHHRLNRAERQTLRKRARQRDTLGWLLDPLRAASLSASGMELGWLPFEERAGASNSGTVSMADQSISPS